MQNSWFCNFQCRPEAALTRNERVLFLKHLMPPSSAMVCSVRSTILGNGAAPAQRPTRGATFWAIRVMDDQLFHHAFERDLVVRHFRV